MGNFKHGCFQCGLQRTCAALAVLAMPTGPLHASIQRWNVDVIGMQGYFVDVLNDNRVTITSESAHGWFTADDQDGDGAISTPEVREIHLFNAWGLTPYPWDPTSWNVPELTFHYTPGDGLVFKQSEYHVNLTFGEQLSRSYDIFSAQYRWLNTTTTTITLVPESSAPALAMAGCLASGLVLARRRQARRAAKPISGAPCSSSRTAAPFLAHFTNS